MLLCLYIFGNITITHYLCIRQSVPLHFCLRCLPLNNFKIRSITNIPFDEHFGFSDAEVKDMLDYYGLEDHYRTIKEWYNGYRFGTSDVYCPWDVINYVDELRDNPDARPRAYWINSSGNIILRTLLQKATPQTRMELDRLVNGSPVTKKSMKN